MLTILKKEKQGVKQQQTHVLSTITPQIPTVLLTTDKYTILEEDKKNKELEIKVVNNGKPDLRMA